MPKQLEPEDPRTWDMSEDAIMTPSGGLLWHWRAFRRRKQWRDFLERIELWLSEWQPQSNHLLLMGPSAGWCLPDSFLIRFKTIIAVDIDPLAHFFFRRLHGSALNQSGTKLVWRRTNLFRDLESLLLEYPDHAVLFPNVLGQHIFHEPDETRLRQDIKTLGERLKNRNWASFHDRLSGDWNPALPMPASFEAIGTLTAADLAEKLGLSGEWLDHMTDAVLPPDTERMFAPWPIIPDWIHWVEFGSVAGIERGKRDER